MKEDEEQEQPHSGIKEVLRMRCFVKRTTWWPTGCVIISESPADTINSPLP